ncbi:MAG: hypothetical protein ACFE94_04910 [Candidatus Hodarchaeota archaeon]
MEANKSKKNSNKTKSMDNITDSGVLKKKSTISTIHVFESDTRSTPIFKIARKKSSKKNKFRTGKTKLRLLANKETDKSSWTPEMRLGYCKHSMRKFVSPRELQNPWDS